MSDSAILEQLDVEQTLERILASQKITPNERRWLILLCFARFLTPRQESLVNQVYEALNKESLVLVETRTQ